MIQSIKQIKVYLTVRVSVLCSLESLIVLILKFFFIILIFTNYDILNKKSEY